MPDQVEGPAVPEDRQGPAVGEPTAASSPGGTAIWPGAGPDCFPGGSEGQDSAGQRVKRQAVRGETWPGPARRVRGYEGRAAPSSWCIADQDFCAGQLRPPSPNLHPSSSPSLPAPGTPPPLLPSPSSPRHTRWARRGPGTPGIWGASRAAGTGRGKLGYFVDAGSVPPRPLRAQPTREPSLLRPEKRQNLSGRVGGSLQGSLQSHDPPPPTSGQIWGTSLETPKVLRGSPTPRVLGRDFPNATKGPRGGPGAGRRAAGGASGPPPRAGNGFPRGSARSGSARTPARNSPCRVRKSRPESMPDGRRSGRGRRATHVRGDCADGLGSEPSKVEGPEGTAVGGDRRWARDTAPPPGPANPRLSPPPPGHRGGPRWGPSSPPPTLAQASGRVPARNSQIPPASSAAATHRPRALSLPRAARPHALLVGASPGLG